MYFNTLAVNFVIVSDNTQQELHGKKQTVLKHTDNMRLEKAERPLYSATTPNIVKWDDDIVNAVKSSELRSAKILLHNSSCFSRFYHKTKSW